MPKREITDLGVIPPSTISAHVPTEFARKALLYPIYSGQYICLKNYSIQRLNLNMCLLVLVEKGSMYFKLPDSHYTVEAGQLILINCQHPHHYAALEDHTEFLWLHFSGSVSEAYFAYFEQIHNRKLIISSPANDTIEKIKSIIHMMEAPYLDEQLASILIHVILHDLTSHTSTENDANRFLHPLVSEAIDHLDHHYHSGLTIKELASELGVSQYYLIRLFKNDTGFTPHEYLQRIRLRNAMEMIADRHYTMESIAFQCGFNSASHFSRSFKKNTGQTPSEFRRYYAPNNSLLSSLNASEAFNPGN